MTRVRRAFLMASVEQYLALMLNFAMVPVLSRLLEPAEIGIAVVGLGICVIVFSFREFVTAEFLIQRETVAREDIWTSATLLLLATAGLAAVLIAAAPALSGFYAQPGLPHFIWIMACAAVVEVAALPTMAVLRRKMEFGRLACIRILGLCCMVATTITLAWLDFGFMSYAWGNLCAAAASVLLTALLSPATFRARPSLRSWRAVVEFGRYRGAAGLVDRIYDAIPQLVLGRFMPMAMVGLYNRANTLCAIPDRMLLAAIFAIAFPALAERVREGRDVRGAYLRAISLITVFYWPSLLLMGLLAHPLVMLLLGDNWLAVVPLVRIVAVASTFFFPVILTVPLLMAVGRNRQAFAANLTSRAFAAAVLCSASPFGITVMASSQFVAIPFQMIVAIAFVRGAVRFDWRDFFGVLARSAAVCAIALVAPLAIVVLFYKRLDLSPVETCAILAAAGIGWLAGVFVTRHPARDEVTRAWQWLTSRLPLPQARGAAG
jgi:O-antigen/teichoic acid export membrane protein